VLFSEVRATPRTIPWPHCYSLQGHLIFTASVLPSNFSPDVANYGAFRTVPLKFDFEHLHMGLQVRTVDLDMYTPISVPSGSTPLHMAAQKGHVAIIQAMLQVRFGTPPPPPRPPPCSLRVLHSRESEECLRLCNGWGGGRGDTCGWSGRWEVMQSLVVMVTGVLVLGGAAKGQIGRMGWQRDRGIDSCAPIPPAAPSQYSQHASKRSAMKRSIALSGARRRRRNCCFPYKSWSGKSLLAERRNQGTPIRGVLTVLLTTHFCCWCEVQSKPTLSKERLRV